MYAMLTKLRAFGKIRMMFHTKIISKGLPQGFNCDNVQIN